MDFTEEQKDKIRAWLEEGASLSQVQNRLKDEFGINMTYLDVRLAVLDIGASVKDPEQPKPAAPVDCAPEPPPEAPMPEALDGSAEDAAVEPSVAVTLDTIVVPGAMVSGTVVFSDGVRARWMIDNTGRFGMDADDPSYRPSDDDMRMFQMQLQSELRAKGYL
jgi:hypothetical protein